MLLRLFLLFTVVPLVELVLLIRIGELLGALPTVGLVAVTGFVGAWLARREGARSWRAVRDELARGNVPGEQLLHTLLIVISGALLVTPGVLTDAVGLSFLLAPVRALVVRAARRRLARGLESGTIRIFAGSTGPFGGPGDGGSGVSPGTGTGTEDRTPDGWHRRSPEEPEDDRDEPGRDTGRVVEL